jgi:outer membrane protein assembly factor BamB
MAWMRTSTASLGSVSVVLAAGLAVGGCSSSGSTAAPLVCPNSAPTAGTSGAGAAGTAAGSANPAVAAGWSLPGGNLASTRDVASAITSSNVSKLGVAWTVPLRIPMTHTDGAYATTPVVVNGVVYVQDLDSNVLAISLATGKVLWRHAYNSPNGGPDGVNVANGIVYGGTNHAAFALSAATGAILLKTPLSAGTNAPVTVDGDYVIAGAGVPLSTAQQPQIIAYKLGATGKLSDTVGS